MSLSLASEINVLAWQLNNLSERDRRFRDFTLYALRDALREVIACFPVYRTYITGASRSRSATAPQIEIAVAWARRRNPAGEVSIFQFIRDVLLLRSDRPRGRATARSSSCSFVQKVQQTTGPVMAKARRGHRLLHLQPLVSLNEVGGEPESFGDLGAGVPPAERRAPGALAAQHALHLDPRHQAQRGRRARASSSSPSCRASGAPRSPAGRG